MSVRVSLPRKNAGAITSSRRGAVSAEALDSARRIVDDVRARSGAAVREWAERFGERAPGEPLVLGRDEMVAARSSLDGEVRGALERAAERIRAFAEAQRRAIGEIETPVPGGRAGHTVEPVASAGCYAPGGRFPLPSSALMGAATARAAGVERVVIATPGAAPVTVAAAAIAGADEVLAVGGPHAIASMAFGFEGFEAVDVVVGPGNAYVTAAKQLVVGVVGIDMLAGPSELLVIADETADPEIVAADLLAQAEHDADASAMLVTTSAELADAVDEAIVRQLADLPTRAVAEAALANGFVCVVGTIEEAARAASRVAPEHLEILTREPRAVAKLVRHAGAVFLGSRSAEVFGDYGAGPNHTLPTGGGARFGAGLSVTHFLRLRTWLELERADEGLRVDTARLARAEGLEGHARAAERRGG